MLTTLAASKRRGINRVTWNMRGKPPRVPKGAQVACSITDRLVGLHKAAQARAAELPALSDFAARLEALRKQIVATTEGSHHGGGAAARACRECLLGVNPPEDVLTR